MSPFPFDEIHTSYLDWEFDFGQDGEKILSEMIRTNKEQPVSEPKNVAPIGHTKKRVIETDTLRRPGKKRPSGMPKRPLSAYNVFFQRERPRIYDESNGRIGFQELGKVIGHRWRSLDAKERRAYELVAGKDTIRYRKEMDVFEEKRRKRIKSTPVNALQNDSSLTSTTKSRSKVVEIERLSSQCTSMEAAPHYPGISTPPIHAFVPVASPSPPPPSEEGQQEENSKIHHGVVWENYGKELETMAVPSSTQVVLPDSNGQDKNYVVSYTCYRMSKKDADAYLATFPSHKVHKRIAESHFGYCAKA
jgi:hypothetical protein|uniref:HMG box domain-containing protein n=1 Tax=Phaeodactylum tricornutum TaxID=2850 RepID=A0A8J9SH56_PHATR